eukprot:11139220-Prorocentrum_lima.AAC.1
MHPVPLIKACVSHGSVHQAQLGEEPAGGQPVTTRDIDSALAMTFGGVDAATRALRTLPPTRLRHI